MNSNEIIKKYFVNLTSYFKGIYMLKVLHFIILVLITYSSRAQQCIMTIHADSNSLNYAALALTSKLIATAGGNKTVKRWNATTGALKDSLVAHTSSVLCVTFSSGWEIPCKWQLGQYHKHLGCSKRKIAQYY